ncbi:(E)-2-((N-methylformamido)methylene)succinate hydrolase [Thermoflexales bacterium]|nr:(E)-2-((N-methylformamido)methylene)succinate hydrolase [Thermoflexales bacterium]
MTDCDQIVKTFHYAGHTLTWEEHSPGQHTLIFLNGYSASRLSWSSYLPHFAPLGRCVTLDLPGHFPAQAPADYDRLTQDLLLDLEANAIRHICPTGSITLIGHSTGGLVALGVARCFPNQVKRVISIDGVIWGPLTGLLGFAHFLLRHHLYPVFWALWRYTQIAPWAMVHGVSFYVRRQLDHWRNPVAWQVCRESHPWYRQQRLMSLAALLKMLEGCDIRPLIKDLPIPILAITGEHDPIVPRQQAQWLAHQLPRLNLHIFSGAGHVPQIEMAEACLHTMLDWLQAHPV